MLVKERALAGKIICNAIYNNRSVRSDIVRTYKLDGPVQQKIPAVKLTPAQIKKNQEVRERIRQEQFKKAMRIAEIDFVAESVVSTLRPVKRGRYIYNKYTWRRWTTGERRES